MKKVHSILPHGNSTKQFEEPAEEARKLADKLLTGKILAVHWVTIEKDESDDQIVWLTRYYKARGVSNMELYGTLMLAAAEYAKSQL